MSKVFKAYSLQELSESKVLKVVPLSVHRPETGPPLAADSVEHREITEAKARAQKVISDAEEMARKLIQAAQEEISQMKEQAALELKQWREQKEQEWEEELNQAKSTGYDEGFKLGKEEGHQQAQREYRDLIDTARGVLEQAYFDKESIIAEAEPFLVELSVAIAGKVIGQELRSHPDLIVGLIRQQLQRSKESVSITVCVHPDDYEYVHNHRQQLLEVVDGQTEVKVFPDYSVQSGGCIIRTSMGSMDARVDTQLEEIRQALMQFARNGYRET